MLSCFAPLILSGPAVVAVGSWHVLTRQETNRALHILRLNKACWSMIALRMSLTVRLTVKVWMSLWMTLAVIMRVIVHTILVSLRPCGLTYFLVKKILFIDLLWDQLLSWRSRVLLERKKRILRMMRFRIGVFDLDLIKRSLERNLSLRVLLLKIVIIISIDIVKLAHILRLLLPLRLAFNPTIYTTIIAEYWRALHRWKHLKLLLVGFLRLLTWASIVWLNQWIIVVWRHRRLSG